VASYMEDSVGQHYMTYEERIRLETLLRHRIPVTEIARELGFARQTIYNEIRRGTYIHTTDFRDEPRYSAQKGQIIHDRRQENKGGALKIGKDYAYADFLERKILQDHYSPAAALAAARREGFSTQICVRTLYNYITMGLFVTLTDKHLPEKPARKTRKKKENEEPKVAHAALPSIEIRPAIIGQRAEPGHWEMDLIIGPQGTKPCLLTLTERMTRKEIITLLPDRRAVTIRRAIDRLERNTTGFRQKFKSITTDNGSEFMEYELLIRSCRNRQQRFEVYYCHSYAAWEKGSVENHNRMIRRFFPKGTDFTHVTKKQVAAVQNWMNNYPRKVLNWMTPLEAEGKLIA